jgi:hypothetical protein
MGRARAGQAGMGRAAAGGGAEGSNWAFPGGFGPFFGVGGNVHHILASGRESFYICGSVAWSSNGRTADSGSVDGGSNPPRATKLANEFGPDESPVRRF